MNTEKWRTLNYKLLDERYLISDTGRIKDLKTGRILNHFIRDGQIHSKVSYNGKSKSLCVPLAILKSFRGKTKKTGTMLYFRDGDKSNINLSNIDILTPKEVFKAEFKKIFEPIDSTTCVLRDGNMENEIWRRLSVHGQVTSMMVSNVGRIYNVMTGNYIHPTKDCLREYPYFTIRRNGKHIRVAAHRAVASLFVHNPDPKKYNVVNHLNEIRTDYRACNLEWTDTKGNVQYSLNTGKNTNQGETAKNATITAATATRICEMLENGCRVVTICNELNVSRGVVRHIRDRKSWRNISEPYDFSHSKNMTYTNIETKEMILNLWKQGVPYTEMSKMTGWGTTTISAITRSYKNEMAKNKQLQHAMVIELNNNGVDITRISRETGLKKSVVRNIIINNE